MERLVYHDECDPQYDAVERYAKVVGESCCEKVEKEYHVYLYREQLYSDFEFSLNIMTMNRRKDDRQNNVLELVDRLKPMMNRWIDKYVGKVKQRFGSVVVEKELHGVSAVAGKKDEIDITIRMGDWWNESVLTSLGVSVHDYVLCGLLYEYLVLSVSARDEVTKSKEQQLELEYENLKNLITAYKPDKIRKEQHPFP